MTPANLQEAAEMYVSQGFVLVEIPHGSKAPNAKDWQHNGISDLAKAREVFSTSHNLGLLHSLSGTCGLDIDDLPKSYEAFDAINLNLDDYLTANTPKIKGAKGIKPVFKMPKGVMLETKKLAWHFHEDGKRKAHTVFELRGAGGQDVLPPSLHPSGINYQWVDGYPECQNDFLELPPELLNLWQKWEFYAPIMQSVSPYFKPPKVERKINGEASDIIQRYNQSVDVSEPLERNGYKRKGKKFVAPGSSTGLAGVVILESEGKQVVYSHHGSDVLGDGHSHDAFDVMRLLECDGDLKSALDEARKRLGIPPFVPGSSGGNQETEQAELASNQIVINRHVAEVVHDVVSQLKQLKINGHPAIYQKSEGLLVELTDVDYKLQERSKPDTLKAFLHDVLRPVTESYKDSEAGYKPAAFNANHAALLLRRSGEFPAIKTISEVPLVLPDGTILLEPGYYARNGYYLNTEGIQIDLIPLDAALKLFLDAFNEFSYQAPKAGFTATLALILQPFLMPYIDDLTPLFGILGSRRAGSGTGKGYLIDCIYRIHKGKPYTHDGSMPATDEECAKVLFSALSEGVSHIIFDDIEHLKHRQLMAAITSRSYKGRILGVSQRHEVSTAVTWVVTGNAPDTHRDFYRRMIPIYMGVGVARAWERTYTNANIHREILDNRNLYLSAAMSIIKHWLDLGQPLSDKTIKGFDRWSAVMGGILESVGFPHLLEARDGLDQLIEVDNSDLDLLVDAWAKSEVAEEPIKAKNLLNLARRINVFAELWDNKSDEAGAAAIAKYIKPFTNDVFGSHYLRREFDTHGKTYLYRLEPVATQAQTLNDVFDFKTKMTAKNPRNTPANHLPDEVAGVLRGSNPSVLIPEDKQEVADDLLF